MTEFFSQKRIDELRECYNLYSDDGFVNSAPQLRCILRSLGYSPTQQKTVEYYKSKKHPIDFAAFLEIAHSEQIAPDPLVEVIRALKGLDREQRQSISNAEFRSILSSIGEKMSPNEIDAVLGQVSINGMVPHQKLIQLISRAHGH